LLISLKQNITSAKNIIIIILASGLLIIIEKEEYLNGRKHLFVEGVE